MPPESNASDNSPERQLLTLATESGVVRITRKAFRSVGHEDALKGVKDHIRNDESYQHPINRNAPGWVSSNASLHTSANGTPFWVRTESGGYTTIYLEGEYWWQEGYEAIMKATPTEGIYYVVRYPNGWELVSKRSEVWEEDNHSDWWEAIVAGMLAKQWAATVGMSKKVLEKQLSQLVYAFPRGRVSEVGGRFIVFQSGDVTPDMGVCKENVEKAFSILNLSYWEYDEHERCIVYEKEELRRILHIQEDWPAI